MKNLIVLLVTSMGANAFALLPSQDPVIASLFDRFKNHTYSVTQSNFPGITNWECHEYDVTALTNHVITGGLTLTNDPVGGYRMPSIFTKEVNVLLSITPQGLMTNEYVDWPNMDSPNSHKLYFTVVRIEDFTHLIIEVSQERINDQNQPNFVDSMVIPNALASYVITCTLTPQAKIESLRIENSFQIR